jgi:ribosomal protein S18 acetylase RimI-like enzyme
MGFYRRLGFTETTLVPGYYDGRIAARSMQLALRDGA